MENGIGIMEKNKVILMYKSEYDECGSYTSNRSEFLILTRDRCVIYNSGSGYEGDDDHIASRVINLKNNNDFIDKCYSHIEFSYNNKENVVDCSGYGGTNCELFEMKIVNLDEIDSRLINGELYFEHEYDVIRGLKFNEYYRIKPFLYSLAGIIPSSMWPNFVRVFIKPIDELAASSWKEEQKKLDSDDTFTGAYFGLYPQSELKDENIIKVLNEKYGTPNSNKEWLDFGYTAKDYQGGYMFYIDVKLDEEQYRGVYIKEYRPTAARSNIARNFDNTQEVNGYKKETVYWFKIEPIKWVKYNEDYSEHYLCLNVIDAEPMLNYDPYDKKDDGANSFFKNGSTLLSWLNDNFLNNAFSENDRSSLEVTILTKEKYLKHFPLKKHRMPRPTDYALIKGYLPDLRSRGNDIPFVWTSTYLEGLNRMVSISKDGSIIDFYSENHGYLDYIYGGVQPAIKIAYGKKIPPQNKFKINFDELETRTFAEAKESEKEEEVDLSSVDFDADDLPF